MKFGVREICDVVFKANADVRIGGRDFVKGQPVLYIDTAKTSTIEGAATTVYATGGRGNSRLLAWEGEKTLTFTVEDALLSPIGFAVLSGAGLFKADGNKKAMVHCVATGKTSSEGKLELDRKYSNKGPIFVTSLEKGSIGEMVDVTVADDGLSIVAENAKGKEIFVDYYTEKEELVTELTIDAKNFAGYYYVEASTLFKDQEGKDLPAEIVFPKVKIQSNFTFSMASTGDPSTFTFTMDAFPEYTMFDRKRKVLCAMQIIEDNRESEADDSVTMLGEDEVCDQEILDKDSKKN